MKLAVLIIALVILISGNVAEPCSGIVIANHIQEKEVLLDNVERPYHLVIDRNTNTLFCSYYTARDVFEAVSINLKDKTSRVITGVRDAFAIAVDSQNHVVYIGGSDGIYRYDYGTNSAVNMGITDGSIWQMFFKDGLYFTVYPTEKAYVYKDGAVKPVPALKDTTTQLVALDKNNNIYFSENDYLKMLVNGGNVTVGDGDYYVKAFNTDVNGDLYFSNLENIYKVVDGSVSKVTSFFKINGFAIEDNNNFIYSDYESVIRLKPTEVVCIDGKKQN